MSDKITPTEARNAVLRARMALAKSKENIEEIAQHSVGTLVVGVTAFAGGFADQRFGTDAGDGVPEHRVGGLPTTLIAGAGAFGATVLGGFGKMSHIGYDAAKGAVGAYMATLGRHAGAKLKAKGAADDARTVTTTSEPAPAAATGT